MKKFWFAVSTVVVLCISLFGFTGTSKAEEVEETGYLSDSEVLEFNKTLDKIKDQANEKLSKDEVNFTISEDTSVSGTPISFTFNADDSTDQPSLSAVREKRYSAIVNNTTGFDFSHRLYGSFTHEKGKVKGYTKSTELKGWAYNKTHVTFADRLDPSVVEVDSVGTFVALKWFKEYKTHITIRLLGSGDYRVTRLAMY